MESSYSSSGGVRFAPSPTGRFHVGNLRTAWISYVWARALKSPWVIRIEDIDRPRVLDGAATTQLADLAALGLAPDRCYFQSARADRHWELLLKGIHSGKIYPCTCSRQEVQEALGAMGSAPHGRAPVYNGACRDPRLRNSRSPRETIAWRFRFDERTHADFIVARSSPQLDHGIPERSGFFPAYQWACAIDDLDGGYDLIVRAHDLADSAEPQRAIQKWLAEQAGFPAVRFPAVFHTSLITQNNGSRLEKRTRGVTLEELLERGITARKLLRIFESSFQPDASDFKPGRVWGEPCTTRSLAKLGL